MELMPLMKPWMRFLPAFHRVEPMLPSADSARDGRDEMVEIAEDTPLEIALVMPLQAPETVDEMEDQTPEKTPEITPSAPVMYPLTMESAPLMTPWMPFQTLETICLMPSQTPCQSPESAEVQTWIMPEMTPTTVEITLEITCQTPETTPCIPCQMVSQLAARPWNTLMMRSTMGWPYDAHAAWSWGQTASHAA